MDKEDLFISNIHSTHHDRISVTCIYDSLSKRHIRGAVSIMRYMRADLSFYCDIICHSLMNRTPRSSGGMPKVRERQSMMKRTMRH
ncbi:hypothetical protein L366_03264 [Klebsiella variicola]|nr:hypothetical protein L366_03264 [Klebsiella variicola]